MPEKKKKKKDPFEEALEKLKEYEEGMETRSLEDFVEHEH